MRRHALCALALLLAVPAAVPASAPALAQNAPPPHAFLFGTWTGGIFPVPGGSIPAQACLSQPVVIFTRDLVMRATLTSQMLTQREIETVRAAPSGVEFRLVGAPTGGPLLGGGQQMQGFGCENPDVLRVQRRGENEISFPGCVDFPNPLVRCQTR